MPGVDTPMLDAVRASCARAAGAATLVHIDHERLAAYAFTLLDPARPPDVADPAHVAAGDTVTTVAFVLVLDTVNFGSGWFPVLRKRPGMTGYHTVATALKERHDRDGPFTADGLLALTFAECAELFGQDPTGPAAELISLFATALHEFGRLVLTRYDGRFEHVVESAEHSADRLARTLAELPSFRDTAAHRSGEVSFYKRAQITPADLALALDGHGLGRFDDLDRLTAFADNLVPHVLRVDGVLRYDDELVSRIDAGELIPSGSPSEVEIRACAVHAVELMRARLAENGDAASSAALDNVLWNRGQDARYKAQPRHRTRTTAY
jgi:hypothetical protein